MTVLPAVRALALALGLLATARADAQLAIDGHLSVGTNGIRLLMKEPGANATVYTGEAGGFDAQVFLPRYRAGFQLARFGAAESVPNGGAYAASTFTLLYGRPHVQAEFGVGTRTGYSVATDRDHDAKYRFLKLGGRYSAPLGTTAFSVGIRGSLYVPLADDPEDGAHGMDAETYLRWTSRRLPLTAAVGFRSEQFRVLRSVDAETGAVSLTVGWAFHRGP